MARFWQHMASTPGAIPVTVPPVHTVQDKAEFYSEPAKVEQSTRPLGGQQEGAKGAWHFLEVGPEGQEEGTVEVLLERKASQRQGGGGKQSHGIVWDMPNEVERYPSQVLRPMFDAVKTAMDGQGTGLVVASHSIGLGPRNALRLVMALAMRAAREAWRVAIVGDHGVAGDSLLPSAPGWLDYLQGQCDFQDILHPWRQGNVAWVPQGRQLNTEEPAFFRHSPASWVRELKKQYPAILLVCGAAEDDSLLSTVARMGDGVLLLATFHEGKNLYRQQDDWARQGVPFLGQMVIPEAFSACATRNRD